MAGSAFTSAIDCEGWAWARRSNRSGEDVCGSEERGIEGVKGAGASVGWDYGPSIWEVSVRAAFLMNDLRRPTV